MDILDQTDQGLCCMLVMDIIVALQAAAVDMLSIVDLNPSDETCLYYALLYVRFQ